MEKQHDNFSTSKSLIISIIVTVGFIVCFLVVHGYNLNFTYSDSNKKIEVQAENFNSTR